MDLTDDEKIVLIKSALGKLSDENNIPLRNCRFPPKRSYLINKVKRLEELYNALPDEYFNGEGRKA